jgi:putative SOS response-associated peptidase YedK
MCNRYRMTAGRRAIAERYGIEVEPEYANLPPPELFPKRPEWVVREVEGVRELVVMQWGVPTLVTDKRTGKKVLKHPTNARNIKSGNWRNMLSNPTRRCLVPVTDFCEWSGERGTKREHWFSLPSAPIFSFAGIWRPSEEGDVFAFLTCGYLGDPSAHIVGAVHETACPVILHAEDEQRWLDGDHADACELAVPFPSQMMAVA